MANEELNLILKLHAVGLGQEARKAIDQWPIDLAGFRIYEHRIVATRPKNAASMDVVPPSLTIDFNTNAAAREFALKAAEFYGVPAYELARF